MVTCTTLKNGRHCVMATETGQVHLNAHHSLPNMTVGDWAILNDDQQFVRLLDRLSLFSRKAAGSKVAEQLIAANVDTVFIVCSLNDDFNLSRIERYLALAIWVSFALLYSDYFRPCFTQSSTKHSFLIVRYYLDFYLSRLGQSTLGFRDIDHRLAGTAVGQLGNHLTGSDHLPLINQHLGNHTIGIGGQRRKKWPKMTIFCTFSQIFLISIIGFCLNFLN